LAFYAELRGEHLNDAVVAAMVQAGLRVAEVGLQTANPAALAASQRRTDLRKWAAGTRRLLDHGVEVLLDVILGLPEDDVAGVRETLDFIRRENLAGYDIFTLQVLPGTAVRREAARFGIDCQERPPYYVLGTSRMSYATLRELRRELKLGAGLDPDAVEGLPEPHRDALALGKQDRVPVHPAPSDAIQPIIRLDLADAGVMTSAKQLAIHVNILTGWEELTASTETILSALIRANPATLFDLYVICTTPPDVKALRTWRAALPYQPGYLDRVAVYQRTAPEPDHKRVSPRVWLVLPWTAQAEPQDYAPYAEIIWRYDLVPGDEAPLGAWRGAGGAGVWAPGVSPEQAAAWEATTDLRIWR
ncbi:MAG: hypothetical protein MI924_02640, partial [Chloroflexales bacterium]|nr:hypothetical protein [Chloroflexales bacterium]